MVARATRGLAVVILNCRSPLRPRARGRPVGPGTLDDQSAVELNQSSNNPNISLPFGVTVDRPALGSNHV
jgi:hypothetical protein